MDNNLPYSLTMSFQKYSMQLKIKVLKTNNKELKKAMKKISVILLKHNLMSLTKNIKSNLAVEHFIKLKVILGPLFHIDNTISMAIENQPSKIVFY